MYSSGAMPVALRSTGSIICTVWLLYSHSWPGSLSSGLSRASWVMSLAVAMPRLSAISSKWSPEVMDIR